MAEVWIPTMLQELTGGRQRVQVRGNSMREIVNNLEEQYPGIKDRLCIEDEIMPGIAVIVDGEPISLGLLQRVREDSEIHFLPAIGGGTT